MLATCLQRGSCVYRCFPPPPRPHHRETAFLHHHPAAQLLEGLGVGAAAVEGQFGMPKLCLLAMGFALTAPIGIALGVGLHSALSEHDLRLLMTLGIVNAIASGMLIYVAIEHMNALSNKGRWLRQQPWWAQLLVLFCFCAGGAAMITIGKWA